MKGQLTEEQKYMAHQIANNPTGVVHMGTWRGKSWVIYNTIVEKYCRTLVLCHNIQTANDIYAGIITNIDWLRPDQVSNINSTTNMCPSGVIDVFTHSGFTRSYSTLGEYDMILYDECDYNLSFPVRQDYHCMIWWLIQMDTPYLYGFTWTPYRAEGGAEVLNRIFWHIWTWENAEYNFIPTITQVHAQYHGDYDFETFAELMQSLATNEDRTDEQLDLYNKHKRKRNLILVKTIEESKKFNNLIPNSILLNGELGKKELEWALWNIHTAIDTNSGFTLVGTIDKLGRGVDIPPIDTIFLFSPVKFRGTVVQAVGRWLRKYPGKTDVMLYDWCDLPILKKQQKERLTCYEQEYWIKDFNFIKL